MSAPARPSGLLPVAEVTGTAETTRAERLKVLIGERRSTIALLAVCSILSAMTEAGAIAIILQVATSIVNHGKRISLHVGLVHANAPVDTMLWIALALTVLRMLLQIPISVLPAVIVADIQAKLRLRLFQSFTAASWGVQSTDREGQLQETMTGQVMQASAGAQQATSLVITTFTFLTLMAAAFLLNTIAALGVLVIAILMFILLRPLRSIGIGRSRKLSAAQIAYAAGVAESVRMAEETRVFGVEEAARGRIHELVSAARKMVVQTQVISKLIPNIYQSLIFIAMVGVVAVLHALNPGHVGALGAVVAILLRAGTNGQVLQANYQGLVQSMPFIERTQEAARRYTDSTPVTGDGKLARVESLAFENVGYAYYDDRPVLTDVNFMVQRGESIGVIGPSGAGKSTLVQLLLQLRVPREGRYLVNGIPAPDFRSADWREQVSYVAQEPRLLHATVTDNIRFFREGIDDAAIERAARLARIHDDIVSWPHGYDTLVGPRADAVSGGQQQRICLARALAANPEVLVLDEPTSALDPHSENLIQESLTALRSELTLFIIAHRMSTLEICDKVMVVIDGRLMAFGPKAALQNDNSYYRSAMQLATGAQVL